MNWENKWIRWSVIFVLLMIVAQCTHAGEIDNQIENQMYWQNQSNIVLIDVNKSQEKMIAKTYEGTSLYYLVKAGALINSINHGRITIFKMRWK